jgi:hypothetical protein
MRFRLSRLTLGEWFLGLASAGLIVDVFALTWFHVGGGPQADGWQSLDVLAPFTLAVAALGVIVWWLTATRRAPGLPASLTAVLLGLSLILIVWLLVRVFLDVPGLGPGGIHVGRDAGSYVAVGLALVLFAGSYLSLRREGVAEVDAVTYVETLRVS